MKTTEKPERERFATGELAKSGRTCQHGGNPLYCPDEPGNLVNGRLRETK